MDFTVQTVTHNDSLFTFKSRYRKLYVHFFFKKKEERHLAVVRTHRPICKLHLNSMWYCVIVASEWLHYFKVAGVVHPHTILWTQAVTCCCCCLTGLPTLTSTAHFPPLSTSSVDMFLFLEPSPANPSGGCVSVKVPVDHQFLKLQQAHVQSNFIFILFATPRSGVVGFKTRSGFRPLFLVAL